MAGLFVFLDMNQIINTVIRDVQKEFVSKKEAVLKEAFAKAGYENLTPEFLKEHCVVKIMEGDPYEHYFVEDKLIISFQQMPDMTNDGMKMTVKAKYY